MRFLQEIWNFLFYLEPAVRAEFAFLGEPLAVAWRDNAEVRVFDHLCNAGLGCGQVVSKLLEVPSQTKQHVCE